MKHVYPALLTPVSAGKFCVIVPDLTGLITEGVGLDGAIDMCRDAICMWLCDAQDNDEAIPAPCEIATLTPAPNQIVTLVDADLAAYRRAISQMAVKKTLTIPSWLNELGEQAGINFSQTLQGALKEQLGVNDR